MVHRIAPPPEIEGLTWVRALGSGGFADVHLYRQFLPARDVAVKVVRNPTESGSVDEMHREADATAAVAGHPAVIELHGAGTTADGRPYLIMEYCPVADIGEQARARPMAVDRTLDLIIRVCGGVEALHRAGLVHRDIKPSNIMLDAYGRPVLADFGVAAPIGELEPGRLDGFSVLWAPPEQQDARTHAHPTQDVWALAATTWTLLTGRSPFEDPLGDNGALAVAHRVRSGRLRGLGRPDAPAQLEGVLRAAMTLDPLERTGSALRLGEDLQGIQRIMGRPVTAMSIEPGGLAAEPVLPAADGSGAAVKTRQHGGAVGGVDLGDARRGGVGVRRALAQLLLQVALAGLQVGGGRGGPRLEVGDLVPLGDPSGFSAVGPLRLQRRRAEAATARRRRISRGPRVRPLRSIRAHVPARTAHTATPMSAAVVWCGGGAPQRARRPKTRANRRLCPT